MADALNPDRAETPHSSDLYELVRAATQDGIEAIRQALADGKTIQQHWEYPTLSWFDNGFPNLSQGIGFSGPTAYEKAFAVRRDQWGAPIVYTQLGSFNALINFASQDDDLRAYYLPDPKKFPKSVEEGPEILRLFSVQLATDAIERYAHSRGLDDWDEAAFKQIYLMLERPVYERDLPVEILVPIVLTHFESTKHVALTPQVSLIPLSDNEHLARWPGDARYYTAHRVVLSAATHALRLTDYVLKSKGIWDRNTSDLGSYPVEEIDALFGLLRVVSGVDTGYAQLLLRPIGWAYEFKANLPPLIVGPVVRRYPEWLEEHAWLRDRPAITIESTMAAGDLYKRISPTSRRLQLALRRLNLSMLRTEETDAVVDVCIGLEALLGDESPTEMTHKLALRVVVISHLVKGLSDPEATFSLVKRLYKLRSKLVHGKADAEKYRMVPESDETMLSVGIGFLRMCIKELALRPDLLDPEQLDKALIKAQGT